MNAHNLLFRTVAALCFCATLQASLAVELVSAPDIPARRSVTANGNSLAPAFSRDGRFLIFTSEASNLVTNDHNGLKMDVFVKELATGNITLVSVTSLGVSGNGHSYAPSISSNGQFVAFLSEASNLVPNDTNGVRDVFVRDLVNGTTMLISQAVDGGSANGESFPPLLTPNGELVCFASRASNLATADNDNDGRHIDLFARDLRNGRILGLSQPILTGAGIAALETDVDEYAISDDGRSAVFTSPAENLVADNPLGLRTTAYVRDLASGSTTRIGVVGVAPPTLTNTLNVRSLSLSPNARYLAFEAEVPTPTPVPILDLIDLQARTNLVVVSHTGQFNLGPYPISFSTDSKAMLFTAALTLDAFAPIADRSYVWKLWTAEGGIMAITNSVTGRALSARRAYLSPDGKRIALLTDAAGVTPATVLTNQFQLYALDLPSNTIRLISASATGQDIGGVELASPQFSPNGRWLAFQSQSATQVANDGNSAQDIFLYDWEANQVTLVSAVRPVEAAPPSTPNGGSSLVARGVSVDGRYVLFASAADELVPEDHNSLMDLFARDLVTRRTRLVNARPGSNVPATAVINSAVLSGNGRYVAFIAESTELVSASTAGTAQVYVRDLTAGRTLLASVTTKGAGGAGRPLSVEISADGRYVVFVTTEVRDLAAGLTQPAGTVLRDLVSSKTTIVQSGGFAGAISASLSGLGGNVLSIFSAGLMREAVLFNARNDSRQSLTISKSGAPLLSYDGSRAVVFASSSVPNATVLWSDSPFSNWREIALSENSLIHPMLSANGQVSAVTLERSSSPDNGLAVLVHLSAGSITRIDTMPSGAASASATASRASLDVDGHIVAFRSSANDLVPNDVNGFPDIFVRDLTAKQTSLINRGINGELANDFSFAPVLSANGRTLVFSSWAGNLVAEDNNFAGDVFALTLPARPFADADGDGMDDTWELAHFGNMLRDGKADFDGDGSTDTTEYLAGTSPINDLSVFRATATASANGTLVISWTSEPGRKYQIRSRDSIGAPWQDLSGIVQGDGTVMTRTVSAPGAKQRFYQVILLP